MSGGHLIGIDVGSQSVKGVLCSPDGRPLLAASHPCRMTHPASGWAEQDPAEWRTGLCAVVHRLLAELPVSAADVSHIGLACQVDGVVPVDRKLSPLRPAIIWLDKRAVAQAGRLVDALSADGIFETTGLVPDASHTAPKMMWLRDEEPHIFHAANLLPPPAAYLLAWLTGRPLQDHANASSSLLYDVTERCWSEPLLEAAALEVERLAPIAASHEVAGPLLAQAAVELGLTTRCLAVVGTGDDHGAALGAGVVEPGLIVDVSGTAEPVGTVAPRLVFDSERLLETHAHAVDGAILLENPGFVSGGSILWLASVLGSEQAEILSWAAEAPAGADGVTFLPNLSGATAPRWNDRMRATFHGLSVNHDRRHLSRAVVEGCVYALRDITTRLQAMGLPGDEIRVVGGGTRTPFWLQAKADACKVPVRPVLGPEPTALGAAILAAVGAGMYPDAASASSQMAVLGDERYEPDAETSASYDDSYVRYRRLFDAVEEIT
ncbi:MAG TPA: FGGY family carbohydrate kinase [Acidimicrobiales bacterium]|nr:FGGY family carbohydrate kinase [Acidimicrobiales bacterium]